MAFRFHLPLALIAALSLVGCTGISTVRIATNGPATVAVDGQQLGPAPVTFPVPWRNIDNQINYSSRKVTVTADGKVVFDRDISGDLSDKARTGDFTDGSQYGTGRTYTINVDVHATPPH